MPQHGTVRIAVIVLALATAAIHLSRALADPKIGPLFGLNAVGYVLLVAALYAPGLQHPALHRLLRRVLLVYTAITIVLYVVWGVMSGEWALYLGPLDKVCEVVLLVLLWIEEQADGSGYTAANPLAARRQE